MVKRSTALLLVLSALALAGCSQQGPAATAPERAAARPSHVLQVRVPEGTTREQLGAAYGAPVLMFDAAEGYAVLGLSAAQASGPGLRTLSLAGTPESNLGAFSAGMTATVQGRAIWLKGDLGSWTAEGRAIWLKGQYSLIPENTLNFQTIRLEQAHTLAPKLGQGIKVAVIDTGVDLEHPAFAGSLAPAEEWRDFYAGDNLPDEEGVLGEGGYGHGTGVAGIVLQVAPAATILPLRVLGPDGSGDVLTVAQAIDWASAKGAQIINLSLGSAERSAIVQDAIKRATERGALVVASAGNENRPAISYPAHDMVSGGAGERSLSVGSVTTGWLKSSFSNYSANLELVALGENVYTPGPDGLLVSWSGTSMATPMAAGGLALALSQGTDVPLKDLTKKMAEKAYDVYNNGLNAPYKDKLGKKGLLNLEAFLKDVVK
ncbi:S8 family serine peptidase [Deinococcus sp. NW-56]|uniref:S8 family serine peptidase n=1 Tax=Deinococcus sp. NW-56 TaxID=2080419 RepID=UPI000CF45DE6|nr:S8 family serine peptidase [Deinococcus sp. NW-56]